MKIANQNEIQAVVRSLGILGSSTAVQQLICAVELSHENINLMRDIMGGLYPAVAEHFKGANVKSVERNLRSVRDRVWARGNVELLTQMSEYPIRLKPTTGEFVDTIRFYMEREHLFSDKW